MVRDAFAEEKLEGFSVTRVIYGAPAIATAEVTLVVGGTKALGALRWIRGDRAGMGVTPNRPGQWQLISWTPTAMVNERSQSAGDSAE
jgi:hypothetical protein